MIYVYGWPYDKPYSKSRFHYGKFLDNDYSQARLDFQLASATWDQSQMTLWSKEEDDWVIIQERGVSRNG